MATKKQNKHYYTKELRKANPLKESGRRGSWGFGGIVRRFVRNSLKAWTE